MPEPEDTASANPTVSPHWVDPTATGDEDLDNVAGVYHFEDAAPPESGGTGLARGMTTEVTRELTRSL